MRQPTAYHAHTPHNQICLGQMSALATRASHRNRAAFSTGNARSSGLRRCGDVDGPGLTISDDASTAYPLSLGLRSVNPGYSIALCNASGRARMVLVGLSVELGIASVLALAQ